MTREQILTSLQRVIESPDEIGPPEGCITKADIIRSIESTGQRATAYAFAKATSKLMRDGWKKVTYGLPKSGRQVGYMPPSHS